MTPEEPTHIYISGPMRGHDGFNFPAFFEAEKHLRALFPDAVIFSPASADVEAFNLKPLLALDPTGLSAGRYLAANDFDEADLRDALGRDLAYITACCDFMVMLKGYGSSKGAMAERATARALGIPMTFVARLPAPPVVEAPAPDSGPPATVCGRPHPGSCRTVGGQCVQPVTPNGSEVRTFEGEARTSAPITAEEVRKTSTSGGQKGVKLAAFDQISAEIEWEVAEHFGKGAQKYDAHNFRAGYPWSWSYSALRRHLAEFWMGKEWDVCDERCSRPEPRGETEHGGTCFNHTGSRVIIAVIWHAMVLAEFSKHRREHDDRYVYDTEA